MPFSCTDKSEHAAVDRTKACTAHVTGFCINKLSLTRKATLCENFLKIFFEVVSK